MSTHGTRYTYRTGCRCEPCARAEANYQRAYYAEIRAARGIGRYSASPALVHIERCRASGMSVEKIAAASGVAVSTIRRAVSNGGTVRAATLRRILAVRPARQVSPIGLTRRVQALTALGWTAAQIGEVAGLNRQTVGMLRRSDNTQPKAPMAAAILRAYDQLSMRTPQPNSAREAMNVQAAKNRAARADWPPPLAWDDDAIDDPRATPTGAGWRKGWVDVAEVQFLISSGVNPWEVADRMNASLSTITRAVERAGLTELAGITRRAMRAEEAA